MQLWEDQTIVHALKHALKSYDYLEYDEAGSKHINALKVRVKPDHLSAKRDFSVAGNICKALEKETGRRFFVPGIVTNGEPDWDTKWTWFNVREQPFHKNVKITYPNDRTDPLIVECYVGEYMNLFVGDPQITQYADANGEIKVEFRVVDRKTGDTRCSKATNVALDLLAKTAFLSLLMDVSESLESVNFLKYGIDCLPPGDERRHNEPIIPDPSGDLNQLQVTIDVSYQDSQGTEYSYPFPLNFAESDLPPAQGYSQ